MKTFCLSKFLANNGNSHRSLQTGQRGRVWPQTHFRCQPGIIQISDRLCGYGLDVHTPPPAQPAAPAILPQPVIVIDTLVIKSDSAAVGIMGTEKTGHRVLLALNQAGIDWAEVAVITPYVGQLLRLLDDFRHVRIPWVGQDDSELNSTGHNNGVAVGTVHRFQGGKAHRDFFHCGDSRISWIH